MGFVDELRKLEDMRARGTLSEEEFQRAKARVLAATEGDTPNPRAQSETAKRGGRGGALAMFLGTLVVIPLAPAVGIGVLNLIQGRSFVGDYPLLYWSIVVGCIVCAPFAAAYSAFRWWYRGGNDNDDDDDD